MGSLGLGLGLGRSLRFEVRYHSNNLAAIDMGAGGNEMLMLGQAATPMECAQMCARWRPTSPPISCEDAHHMHAVGTTPPHHTPSTRRQQQQPPRHAIDAAH